MWRELLPPPPPTPFSTSQSGTHSLPAPRDSPCNEMPLTFLGFPCVCPEPVLVNRSFQNQKIWLKKRRFTHQGRCPHPGRAGCRRAFRVSCQCPGPRTPHRLCCGAASCEREESERSSVSSLPYVCPEPVLVKLMIIFSSIKSGSKRECAVF